jgi:hypothetical protein
MIRMLRWIPLLAVALPGLAGAQTFEAIGTRAAGMGGAFVAVADDASAAYWNPAGFAAGSYFSLTVDRTAAKVNPHGDAGAGSRSGFLIAIGAPPVGLSYYRLRSTILAPVPVPTAGVGDSRNHTEAGKVRLETLVTHHTGATLVQSIAPGIAVGATLKLVRGVAAAAVEPDDNRKALLEDAGDLLGKGSTRFDTDLGVMASAGHLKAGLTLRNVTAPRFRTAGAQGSLKLERQARAGVSVAPTAGWLVAADLDLTKTAGPLGAVRNFAAGAEGRLARKAIVRGGLQLNTAGDREPAVTAGGSYAATASLLVDVQVTAGTERAARGWGIAARIGF